MLKIFSKSSRSLLVFVAFVLSYLFYILVTLPDASLIKGCFKTSMYSVHLCPGSYNYSSLSDISAHLKNSVLVSEDGSFYNHNGFDFFEIKKSISQNIKSGEYHRGGSTITQQLVKNVFLSAEKSITRKIKEAILTAKLEYILSKNQIFERYLNVVEFGPNIFGIKQASSYYFGKAPSQLNSLESAFLAFLLPNPDGYSVSFRKQKLTPFARQGVLRILQRLMAYRRLSADEYLWAKSNIEAFPWAGLGANIVSIGDDSPILSAPVEVPTDNEELIAPDVEEEVEEAVEGG